MAVPRAISGPWDECELAAPAAGARASNRTIGALACRGRLPRIRLLSRLGRRSRGHDGRGGPRAPQRGSRGRGEEGRSGADLPRDRMPVPGSGQLSEAMTSSVGIKNPSRSLNSGAPYRRTDFHRRREGCVHQQKSAWQMFSPFPPSISSTPFCVPQGFRSIHGVERS